MSSMAQQLPQTQSRNNNFVLQKNCTVKRFVFFSLSLSPRSAFFVFSLCLSSRNHSHIVFWIMVMRCVALFYYAGRHRRIREHSRVQILPLCASEKADLPSGTRRAKDASLSPPERRKPSSFPVKARNPSAWRKSCAKPPRRRRKCSIKRRRF